MAENMIKFLRGNVASLPDTATAGALYFTKDEGVYLGLENGTYHRYGDFITVTNVDSLPAAGAHENCMYYCVAENILAKWNGTGWTQINKQKTLAELGGVSSTTYTTDKANLVQADADNATAIEKVKTLVGSIPGGATATTVVGYIDEKTAGIASDATVTALTNRVTTAEGKLDTLTGEESVAGSVKAIAKSYANGKDAAIAEAKTAADAAKAGVDALQGTIDSAVEAATADLDYTATGMAKGKTIKSLTQVDGKINAEFEDIEITQSQVAGLSNALSNLSTAIDTEKSRAEGIERGLRTDVDTIKGDYLKAADKTELAGSIADVKSDVDTFLSSAEIGGNAIDTLKELQDYINTHGEAAATLTTKVGALETTVGKAAEGENPATGLVKGVADNAAAIATEMSRAEGVEATLAQADTDNLAAAKKYADDKITELGIGNYAKKTDLDTHTGNSDIHITAVERTKWDAAEGKAHTHTNKALLDTYTQTEENLADAVAKKHEHANKTVLDGITDEKVSAWDSAQANAASALSSAKTELEGKITAAQSAAEGKVTELANGAVAANTAAIAVINGTGEGSFAKADATLKTQLEAYADTAESDAIASAKAYTDSALSWGSF